MRSFGNYWSKYGKLFAQSVLCFSYLRVSSSVFRCSYLRHISNKFAEKPQHPCSLTNDIGMGFTRNKWLNSYQARWSRKNIWGFRSSINGGLVPTGIWRRSDVDATWWRHICQCDIISTSCTCRVLRCSHLDYPNVHCDLILVKFFFFYIFKHQGPTNSQNSISAKYT